jgi:hypothetical protein
MEGDDAMNRKASAHLLWILAAGLFGFGSAFVFGDVLALPRRWFLVPHVALTLAFLLAYARWSGTELRRLARRRLVWGTIVAAAVGAFLILNVVGQRPSPAPQGLLLAFDIVWLGVVYGAVDGLLLSVMPILATWRAGRQLGWTSGWRGRIATALLAVVASAFITATYHFGYAEFRGPALRKAVVGNVIMSAGQLAAGSPIASVGSHIAMHVAAVLHGPDTTVQLPPHVRVAIVEPLAR